MKINVIRFSEGTAGSERNRKVLAMQRNALKGNVRKGAGAETTGIGRLL